MEEAAATETREVRSAGGVAGSIPEVSATTRAMRRLRAEQLDLVYRAFDSWSGRCGYRSPTDWLVHATGEAAGHCKITVHLAERIQHMPVVKAAFGRGEIAECPPCGSSPTPGTTRSRRCSAAAGTH